MTVGVKDLKNRLGHYLLRAKRGEEVIVTQRGKPVVVIRAVESEQAASVEAWLAKAAAQGKVIPATRKPLKKIRLVKARGVPLSKLILDDRR